MTDHCLRKVEAPETANTARAFSVLGAEACVRGLAVASAQAPPLTDGLVPFFLPSSSSYQLTGHICRCRRGRCHDHRHRLVFSIGPPRHVTVPALKPAALAYDEPEI